ncbi:MAG: hypothetical protein HW421_855 [Ignavibacteria bacterium]|nr:hypothetical protein [Ignavibacteria bacterium]
MILKEHLVGLKALFSTVEPSINILEVNSNAYLDDIIKALKIESEVNPLDISDNTQGGNIYWFKKEAETKNNLIVYGWNKVFPDDYARYKVWALNFNKLTEEFVKLDRKIVFCLSSFIVDLIRKFSEDFVKVINKEYNFKDIPSNYKDMDENDIMPYMPSLISKDDANMNILLLKESIEKDEFAGLTPQEKEKIYFDLNENYKAINDYEKSNEFLGILLESMRKRLPGTHMDYYQVFYYLSINHLNLRNFNDALMWANKGSVVLKSNRDRAEDLTNVQNSKYIGYIYLQEGDFGRALQNTNRALSLAKQLLPEFHPDVAALNEQLSKIFKNIGDLKRALAHGLEALRINKNAMVQNPLDVAQNCQLISIIYFDFGFLSKALEFAKLAFTIRQKSLDLFHPSMATAYNNVANIYRESGDLKQALLSSKKSLEILENVLPEDNNYIAMANNHIAYIYFALNIKHSALFHIKKAIEIWKKMYPGGHVDIDYATKLMKLVI